MALPAGSTTFSLSHVYAKAPTGAQQQVNVVNVQIVDVHTGLGTGATTATVIFYGLGAGGNPNGGSIPAFFIPQNTALTQLTGGGGEQIVIAAQPLVLSFTTVQFEPRALQSTPVADAKPVVALRIVNLVTEAEVGVVILPVDVLNNLSALFSKLPDDHYRLYYIEQGTERLIMDVMVRGGKPLDPLDTSEGTQDRPPTSRISPPNDAGDKGGHFERELGDAAPGFVPDVAQKAADAAVLSDSLREIVLPEVVSPVPAPRRRTSSRCELKGRNIGSSLPPLW